MSQPRTPRQLVELYLSCLLDDGSFVVSDERVFRHFGNWVVLLRSDDYRVQVFVDRGEVWLKCGPNWDPPGWQAGPWIIIEDILTYLGESSESLARMHSTVEEQLAILAEMLCTHRGEVRDVLVEQNWENNRTELERITRDRQEAVERKLGIVE